MRSQLALSVSELYFAHLSDSANQTTSFDTPNLKRMRDSNSQAASNFPFSVRESLILL